MREFHGECQRGAITYILRWPLDGDLPVRRCACSFCTKQGSRYTSHPDAALSVTLADPERLSRYRFGTETADFCFCSNCGTFLFVTSAIDGRLFAVVNVNPLTGASFEVEVPTRRHDGETRDERIARRRRSWIADVTITSVGS